MNEWLISSYIGEELTEQDIKEYFARKSNDR